MKFNKLFVKILSHLINYRKNMLQKIPRFHHYNLGKHIVCVNMFFHFS